MREVLTTASRARDRAGRALRVGDHQAYDDALRTLDREFARVDEPRLGPPATSPRSDRRLDD
jgi:hypothetical protein